MATKRTAAGKGGVWTDAHRRVTAIITLLAACMALLVNAKSLGLSSWLALLTPDLVESAAHRVVLVPRADTLRAIGEPSVITATVTDAHGGMLAGAVLRWRSSDSSVAAVDSTGMIVARGPGRATIEVSLRDLTATAAVLVRPVPVQVRIVADSAMRLADGDSVALRAVALDARGHPVHGTPIAWRSSSPSVIALDSAGLARALRPGTVTVTAAAGEITSSVAARVELTPAEVAVVNGAGQRALAGRSLAAPIVLEVRTRTGQPVPGAQVVLTTADGEGRVSPDTARSDARGRVRATWTLGRRAGAHHLLAHAESVDSVVVVLADADPAPGDARIEIVSTDLGGTVLREIDQPVRLRVTDSLGTALAHVRLAWTALDGGGVTGAERTDSVGFADARWRLGPRSGGQRLLLQVGNARFTPVTALRATALAGPPTSLSVTSGDRQSATVGEVLGKPVVLRVRDSIGNPVAGVRIIGRPAAGGLVDTSVVTAADGTAPFRWVLGAKPGPQRLRFDLTGTTVSQVVTAVARPGPPAAVTIATRETSARGTLRVIANVVDGQGNAIGGAAIAFGATAGSLSATQGRSDARGIAVVTWTPGGTVAEARITAKVVGSAIAGTVVVPTKAVPVKRP